MYRLPAAFFPAQPPRYPRCRCASGAHGIPPCLAQEARSTLGRYLRLLLSFTSCLRGTGDLEMCRVLRTSLRTLAARHRRSRDASRVCMISPRVYRVSGHRRPQKFSKPVTSLPVAPKRYGRPRDASCARGILSRPCQ